MLTLQQYNLENEFYKLMDENLVTKVSNLEFHSNNINEHLEQSLELKVPNGFHNHIPLVFSASIGQYSLSK